MDEMKHACKFLLETPNGRDYLGDIDVNWRIILKWILTDG
jgi:hypothetical protein